MEKPLAMQAGLGWQGKHTNLVSKEFGSWLFLSSIFINKEITETKKEEDHCGSCSSCIDVCPTKAIIAPYEIDARKCISYLTIEHKGNVDEELRHLIGNRIYGCDDCLAVCPWNKFAQKTDEVGFKSREDLVEPDLENLVNLDDESFRKKFSQSSIKRIGRDRFIRNVLIAIGNSKNSKFIGSVQPLLTDSSTIVRSMAVWALKKIMNNFDHIIESKELGIRKPDLDFYIKALEITGADPKETIFLDDLGINLKPARELGMATIKVSDSNQALKELTDLTGINLE